jgi:hypothetical protein
MHVAHLLRERLRSLETALCDQVERTLGLAPAVRRSMHLDIAELSRQRRQVQQLLAATRDVPGEEAA